MSGTAFHRLGPRARAALHRAIRQAFDAGVAHNRQGRGLNLGQVQDYALNLVETAMIHDAADAEAGASCGQHAPSVTDPHA